MSKKINSPKKILVVRFRQMGDAILATSLLNTLHKSFPEAKIDFVLNQRIAPLFEGHPSVNHIWTFSDDERHSVITYIKKVWHIVRSQRYDAIIDMRSTFNTMLFALFSPSSALRVGIRKPYTCMVFNNRIEGCEDDESMIDHNLQLAKPFERYGTVVYDRSITLEISDKEKSDFRAYMEQQGIDFSKPVMLVGVTAKLDNKTWAEDRMISTLAQLIGKYPDMQLIFNYAPGREAENARRIYDALPERGNVFINIEARSARQLAAMSYNCTAYFGNEGGARHIVQAMGRPSMVICSPVASKKTWLPDDCGVPAWGIAASDIADTKGMSHLQQYSLITVDHVWPVLQRFCDDIVMK